MSIQSQALVCAGKNVTESVPKNVQRVSIFCLPSEMLVKCFSFLSVEDLQSTSRTCRRFYTIVHTSSLPAVIKHSFSLPADSMKEVIERCNKLGRYRQAEGTSLGSDNLKKIKLDGDYFCKKLYLIGVLVDRKLSAKLNYSVLRRINQVLNSNLIERLSTHSLLVSNQDQCTEQVLLDLIKDLSHGKLFNREIMERVIAQLQYIPSSGFESAFVVLTELFAHKKFFDEQMAQDVLNGIKAVAPESSLICDLSNFSRALGRAGKLSKAMNTELWSAFRSEVNSEEWIAATSLRIRNETIQDFIESVCCANPFQDFMLDEVLSYIQKMDKKRKADIVLYNFIEALADAKQCNRERVKKVFNSMSDEGSTSLYVWLFTERLADKGQLNQEMAEEVFDVICGITDNQEKVDCFMRVLSPLINAGVINSEKIDIILASIEALDSEFSQKYALTELFTTLVNSNQCDNHVLEKFLNVAQRGVGIGWFDTHLREIVQLFTNQGALNDDVAQRIFGVVQTIPYPSVKYERMMYLAEALDRAGLLSQEGASERYPELMTAWNRKKFWENVKHALTAPFSWWM